MQSVVHIVFVPGLVHYSVVKCHESHHVKVWTFLHQQQCHPTCAWNLLTVQEFREMGLKSVTISIGFTLIEL